MLQYPNIDPALIRIGTFELRWYGLMYVMGFLLSFFLIPRLFKYRDVGLKKEQWENLMFYIILGLMLGARLGYVLFYDLPFYVNNPGSILSFWQGGMSFHGGAIGLLIAGYCCCRAYRIRFFSMADVCAPIAAIGLGLGRLGNFINAELYGRVTSLPWGMVFPGSDGQPRHPSQLYEAFLEGFLLCAILYILLRTTKRSGLIFWSFIGLYGVFRFLIEFVREPDSQLGFVLGPFTMGQVLCMIMIIAGVLGIAVPALRRKLSENP